MACKSASQGGKESLDECTCTICMCILIEPVTLPCGHELCMPCFKQNVEEANLTCPLCRTRISNWARKAKKTNSLVDQKRWEQVRRLFPTKVQRRLEGLDDEGDEDDVDDYIDIQYRHLVHLSKPGEIREEYEAELKKLAQRAEEERQKEEAASAVLIEALVKAENEYNEERQLLQEIAKQDESLARKLAQSEDFVGADTPCDCVHKNFTCLHRNPLHGHSSNQSDGDSSENRRQDTKKHGNKTLQIFFRPLLAIGKAVAGKTHSSADTSEPLVSSPTLQNDQATCEARLESSLQQRSASGPLVSKSSDSACESECLGKSGCEENAWDDEKTVSNVQKHKGTDQTVDGNGSGLKNTSLDQTCGESVQTAVGGSLRLPKDHPQLGVHQEHSQQLGHPLASYCLARLESSHSLFPDNFSSQAVKHKALSEEERKPVCPNQTYGSMLYFSCRKQEVEVNSECKQVVVDKWQSTAAIDTLCDKSSAGQPGASMFDETVGSLSPPARQVGVGGCLSVPGGNGAGSPSLHSQQALHDADGVKSKEMATKTDLSPVPPCGPGQKSSTVGIFNPATVQEWSGDFYANTVSTNNIHFSTKQTQNAKENKSGGKNSCVQSRHEVANHTAVQTNSCPTDDANGICVEMSENHRETGNVEAEQEETSVCKPKGSGTSRRKTVAQRSASAGARRKTVQTTNPQQSIKNWFLPSTGESSNITNGLNKQESSFKRKALKNQADNFHSSPGVSPSKNRKNFGMCSRLLHSVNNNTKLIPNNLKTNCDADASDEDEEELTQEERDYRFALQVQQQLNLADKFHLQVLRFKGSDDAYSLRKGSQH